MKKTFYIMITILLLYVIGLFMVQVSSLFLNIKTAYLVAIATVSIIGGAGLGETWWQWVYVQRRHRKFRKEKRHK